MPRALKVREDNLWYIIAYGVTMNMNLNDIKDTFEVASQDGFDFYVITDGTLEEDNVTFTEAYASDFSHNWKFVEAEQPYQFSKIERI